MNSNDNYEFFENGFVKLIDHNFHTRTSLIKCSVPNCLLQAISPVLLGSGIIDNLSLSDPILVWVPKLSEDRIVDLLRPVVDFSILNKEITNKIEEYLSIYKNLSQALKNPADLIPILPMGVYVTFNYRVHIDKIPAIMFEFEKNPVVGVQDFQWGLAVVLKKILEEFENGKTNLLK